MVAYRSPIAFTDSATLRGSSRSIGKGLPVSILQKSQRLVQRSPPIKNVASLSSQHSKIFGHAASWQTVCKPSLLTNERNLVYSGPILARVLIQSGLRSIGVSVLRASMRSNLRPSGAIVMRLPYRVLRLDTSQQQPSPQKNLSRALIRSPLKSHQRHLCRKERSG